MKRPRVIVAGTGRCGSSLVMQMLDAGGWPTTGEYPAFEDIEMLEAMSARPKMKPQGATKALIPWLTFDFVQRGSPTSWIWIERDAVQCALSQDKWARALLGLSFGRRDGHFDDLVDSIRSENRIFPVYMAQRPHRLLKLSFEQIITRPYGAAGALREYLDAEMSVEAMGDVVRPRGVGCYRGLLEAELVSNHHGKNRKDG